MLRDIRAYHIYARHFTTRPICTKLKSRFSRFASLENVNVRMCANRTPPIGCIWNAFKKPSKNDSHFHAFYNNMLCAGNCSRWWRLIMWLSFSSVPLNGWPGHDLSACDRPHHSTVCTNYQHWITWMHSFYAERCINVKTHSISSTRRCGVRRIGNDIAWYYRRT